MKKMILIGLAMVAVLLICNNGYAQRGVPLPKDIVIKPPSPELPKEIVAISGKWKGAWDKEVDFILVVTEIDSEKAEIIYACSEGLRINTMATSTLQDTSPFLPSPLSAQRFRRLYQALLCSL